MFCTYDLGFSMQRPSKTHGVLGARSCSPAQAGARRKHLPNSIPGRHNQPRLLVQSHGLSEGHQMPMQPANSFPGTHEDSRNSPGANTGLPRSAKTHPIAAAAPLAATVARAGKGLCAVNHRFYTDAVAGSDRGMENGAGKCLVLHLPIAQWQDWYTHFFGAALLSDCTWIFFFFFFSFVISVHFAVENVFC